MEIRGIEPESVDQLVHRYAITLETAVRKSLASVTHAMASHKVLIAASGEEIHTEPSFAALDQLAAFNVTWQHVFDEDLVPELMSIYVLSAGTVSKQFAKEHGKTHISTPSGDYAKLVLQASLSHVHDFAGDVIKTAERQITLGLQDGSSIDEIASSVAEVAEIRAKKAKVIAQTAVIGAVNGGEWAQMMQLASAFDMVATKTWEATNDTHTRETHRMADGQTVPLGDHFSVGEALLRYPGDPVGPPQEIISCRCTTLFNIDDKPENVNLQTSPDVQIASAPAATTELTAAVNAEFNAMHPRGKDGKFITKGTGLPAHALKMLTNLRQGTSWNDFLTPEKDAYVQSVGDITLDQWQNLKPEDQKHIADAMEHAMEEGIPGSGHAVMHIEDLQTTEVDLKPNEDVFNPATHIPAHVQTQAQHAPQAEKKVAEIKPTHVATPFEILKDTGDNGDGYAAPGLWGKYGAAGVMIAAPGSDGKTRFLVVQRGPMVSSNKGKWQLAGGALNSKETPEQGAAREIFEEIGAPQEYLATMKKVGSHDIEVPIPGKKPWKYSNIVAEAPTTFDPKIDGTETGDAKWLTEEEIKQLAADGKLHPALAKNLDQVFTVYHTGKSDVSMGTKKDEGDVAAVNTANTLSIEEINKQYFKGLITESEYNQLMSDMGYAPTPAHVPEPATPTTTLAKATPVKMTHGLIHSKHTPGTVIGQTTVPAGGVVVKWNGKEYEVTLKKNLNAPGGVTTNLKKSALYGYLAKNFPNAKWTTPGKQDITVNAPSIKEANFPGHTKLDKKLDEAFGELPKSSLTPSEAKPLTPSNASQKLDMTGWKKITGQKGSNKGGIFEAPDGTQYYVKGQKSQSHANNEVLANALYKAAGIETPEVHHVESGTGPWKYMTASKIIHGKSAYNKLTNPDTDPKFTGEIQSGFAVDAWLGNWDVVGAAYDNIIDADGKPLRIDAGGSLLYRAMGDLKDKKDFGDKVYELDSLKTEWQNPNTAKVFGSMTPDQEKESAKRLLGITDQQIDEMVLSAGMDQSLADKMKKRRAFILEKYGLSGNDNSSLAKEDLKAIPTPELKKTEPPSSSLETFNGHTPVQNWNDVIDGAVNAKIIASTPDGYMLIYQSGTDDFEAYGPDGKMMAVISPENVNDLLPKTFPGQKWYVGDVKDTSSFTSTTPTSVDTDVNILKMAAVGNPPNTTVFTGKSDKFPKAKYKIATDETGTPTVYYGLNDDDVWKKVPATSKLEKVGIKWTSYAHTPHSPEVAKPSDIAVLSSPVATPSVGVDHIASYKKHVFYNHFKAEKVSPAWSGAKIYNSLQVAKSKMSGDSEMAQLTDDQMLAIVDHIHWLTKPGQSKNAYRQKVKDWLKTPNGKKAAFAAKQGGWASSNPVAVKKTAKKVSSSTLPPVNFVPVASLDHIKKIYDDTTLNDVYNAVKAKPTGNSVKSPPAELFETIHNVAEINGLEPGTVAAIMDIKTQEKYGNVSHTYTETLNDWLHTPAGKKAGAEIQAGTYVKPVPKPKKAKKGYGYAKSSGYTGYSSTTYGSSYGGNYTHAADKPFSEKVQDVNGTIPAYALTMKSDVFKVVSTSEAKSMWAEMQKTHGPLTTSQKSSQKYYTSNAGYAAMNKYLRGFQGATDTTQKHVNDAQAGMRPSTKPIILHRGSGWFKGFENAAAAKANVGKSFRQEGFFSGSVGGHAAFGGNIKFEIEAPAGTPMALLYGNSNYNSENEMLLAAGLHFHVISVKETSSSYGGSVTIRVRVVQPGASPLINAEVS